MMPIFLQAVNILLVVSVIGVLLWRVLENAGVPLKYTLPKPVRTVDPPPSLQASAKVFGCSLLFRFFVIALSVVIYGLFIEKGKDLSIANAINNWTKWDANNYIRISEGYTSYQENGTYPTLVFFPLYSVCLALVRLLVGNAVWAGLIASALLSSLACVYLYKLVCLDYPKQTAQCSVLLLCLFPFGFFYSGIMSESAFLCTTVMALYYARRHNWWATGICGFFAALSRSLGVFLVIPVFLELLCDTKLLGNLKSGKTWIASVKKGSWLLLFPLGTLVYLYLNYSITGNPFHFLYLEKEIWHQVSVPFYQIGATLWSILRGNYTADFLSATFYPGALCVLGTYLLLALGVTRHNPMYLCWMLISIMFNTGVTWPLSLCRYVAGIVPIYIILADFCHNRPKLSLSFFISFSMLFGVYFTGYLLSKSIM